MSSEAAAKRLAEHRAAKTATANMGVLADSALQGVTVAFLAQVFRMDPQKVKRKLVNCPVLESRLRGEKQVQNLYDLKTAAEFLIEPKIDPQEFIKRIRKEDLPPAINSAYWDALLKRQKWEENAGELWRTEKITEVLGTMFQTIKFTIQLWADNLERETGLTDEQREVLNRLTDSLQADIFQALSENAKISETRNMRADLPKLLREEEPEEDPADALI